MGKNGVLVAIFASICTQAFAAPEDPCPLRLDRPPVEAAPAQEFPPASNMKASLDHLLAEPTENLCGVLKEKLSNFEAFRVKLLAFHRKTVSPTPRDYQAESRLLSRELSALIVSGFFRRDEIWETGKICNGKPMSESVETSLVQLVRTIYASDEYLRKIAGIHGTLLELGGLPDIFKRFSNLIQEEKALRDERFVKRSCVLLAEEYEKIAEQCGPRKLDSLPGSSAKRAPLVLTEARKRHWDQIRSRFEKYQKASLEAVGGKPYWQQLVAFGKSGKVDAQDSFALEDAFFRQAAPMLKMCGLMRLFADAKGEPNTSKYLRLKQDPPHQFYKEQCSAFFCAERGLLRTPDYAKQEGGFDSEQLCAYVKDYRKMEQRYLEGFKAAARRPRATGPISFCPAPDKGTVRHLPPVHEAPKTH